MGAGRKHLHKGGGEQIDLLCGVCMERDPDRWPGSLGLASFGSQGIRLSLVTPDGPIEVLRDGLPQWTRWTDRKNRECTMICPVCGTTVVRSAKALHQIADRERRLGRDRAVLADSVYADA